MPANVATAMTTMPKIEAATPAVFAHVDVYRDVAPVLDCWASLEKAAPCSVYQTRAWLLPWIETLGGKAGVTPLFIVARGPDDSPVAFFGLGIVRRGPLRIATWLGGSDANFNMGLFRPDVAWSRDEILRLFREAAKASRRDGPDLYSLCNQPFDWKGRTNPLALLPHRASPSAAFGTTLPADPETLFASKLSKDTRKKLRKKEAKLAALGPLTHLVVATEKEQRRVIQTCLAQKAERFRQRKIVSDFACPEMRDFMEMASAPLGHGIELHALLVGERIVATYGGGGHDGQWSGMFNSFDADEDIARSSPGDLLLLRIIAKACKDGLTRFDLGIGEARYKATFCDTQIPLFDSVVPINVRGLVAAQLIAARQGLKRAIKSNPLLFALARKVMWAAPSRDWHAD